MLTFKLSSAEAEIIRLLRSNGDFALVIARDANGYCVSMSEGEPGTMPAGGRMGGGLTLADAMLSRVDFVPGPDGKPVMARRRNCGYY